MEKTEFEQMRDKALTQLMNGQSLTGKDEAVSKAILGRLLILSSKRLILYKFLLG